MVRVSGFLSVARSTANGPEWTHEGPQNGPQIFMEFWGSFVASSAAVSGLALITWATGKAVKMPAEIFDLRSPAFGSLCLDPGQRSNTEQPDDAYRRNLRPCDHIVQLTASLSFDCVLVDLAILNNQSKVLFRLRQNRHVLERIAVDEK